MRGKCRGELILALDHSNMYYRFQYTLGKIKLPMPLASWMNQSLPKDASLMNQFIVMEND